MQQYDRYNIKEDFQYKKRKKRKEEKKKRKEKKEIEKHIYCFSSLMEKNKEESKRDHQRTAPSYEWQALHKTVH